MIFYRKKLTSLEEREIAIRDVNGYISPDATISGGGEHLGVHVLIGGGTIIERHPAGGAITIEAHAHLYGNTTVECGEGGSIHIGAGTHIQPGCHLHSYIQPIHIGSQVEIAANCAFYSYNHGMLADRLIMDQPLTSRGGIRIGDGAWLGHGVIVLDNVSIGAGAVIGAGSVVTRDIPSQGIAVGSPAKILSVRQSSL